MLIGRAIAGSTGRASCQREVGGYARPDGAWGGNDTPPEAMRNSWPTRCGGSAPTTSTSTVRRGWTEVPTRRRSAASPRCREGLLRTIGLSEWRRDDPPEPRRAPILRPADRYSLISRASRPTSCDVRELGIGVRPTASCPEPISDAMRAGPRRGRRLPGAQPAASKRESEHNPAWSTHSLEIAQARASASPSSPSPGCSARGRHSALTGTGVATVFGPTRWCLKSS